MLVSMTRGEKYGIWTYSTPFRCISNLASIAQLVEHLPGNLKVPVSNPDQGMNFLTTTRERLNKQRYVCT